MGFGNIGWFQILVVLLIVLLVFGTKKIRTLGGDLGGAIRDFRKGMNEEDAEGKDKTEDGPEGADSADGAEASSEKKNAKTADKKSAEPKKS